MYTPYLERLLDDETKQTEWRMLDRALIERTESPQTLWQRLQTTFGLQNWPVTRLSEANYKQSRTTIK